MKRYYYMDASILLAEDFYLVLDELLAGGDECIFLLDAAVRREIDTYQSLGEREKALLLENYFNLFSLFPNSLEIDTLGGFDPVSLVPMAKDLTVLTARRTLVDHFASLGSEVRFCHVVDGKLQPFLRGMNENAPAYYLEEDAYLIPFDIDEIEYVFSPRFGYLHLDRSKEFAGGEGVCYRTYNNLFCKLYFKSHMTYQNFKRLQAMVEMGCTNDFIAWPLDILYYKNQFVGYLMRELTDVRSVDELRDDGFSGFRILDRFIIARNFLRVIEYLHERDILVGDMKLDNIMVKPNGDVYIIDAGSFQVKDYPCDVCHKEYTERIYMDDELKKILRSVGEEYFPINKILFEILMMKGPFYSRNNTEIDGDGARIFSYPMTSPQPGEQLPYHLRVWYALSPAMRRYFYHYFVERKITSLAEWIRELDLYILEKQKAVKEKQNG